MSTVVKIHEFLIKKEKTLALAESCTGGALSLQFVLIPDASKYLLGSLVCYSTELKHKILKVSNETLRICGSVSREVADEMWIGLMKLTQADYGITITGISGPKGGTKEKPVGTVFIALGISGQKPKVVEFHLSGSREDIIQETCQKACEEFIQLII